MHLLSWPALISATLSSAWQVSISKARSNSSARVTSYAKRIKYRWLGLMDFLVKTRFEERRGKRLTNIGRSLSEMAKQDQLLAKY
jgi:hypothetical protein